MQDVDRPSGAAYRLLAFLTILNVLNFVDRQLLASFANFIVPDLGLTDTQYGLLTGFAFILFYAVMGLFMGALADMVHRPRLIAGGLSLWSGLTALSGAATGFITLAIPRAFIGIGESALTPTALSLLSDRFPAERRGFASGVYYMGVPIGVGASLIVAGALGPAIGWRNCFYLLGAIGIVFAVFMAFVPDPRFPKGWREARAAEPNRPRAEHESEGLGDLLSTIWGALTRCPALSFTIAGGVAYHFILGAAAFDQLWLVQERGFERAHIALWSGIVGMVGGVIGNLVGGVAGDWWLKRTGQGRPMFLVWLGLAMAPFGLAYRLVPGDSVFIWIGIFLGYFQLGTFYGPTFATVQELVPARVRATVVAFYMLTLNLIGLGVGITLGGILVDALRDRGIADPYTKTLVAFTILSLLAIPFFYLAGRRYESDRQALLAWDAGRRASS